MKTELVISASSDRADIALLEDGRLQELIKEKEMITSPLAMSI